MRADDARVEKGGGRWGGSGGGEVVYVSDTAIADDNRQTGEPLVISQHTSRLHGLRE